MNDNIFSKILYGLKVANDNIVVLNEKVDALRQLLTYEESAPNEALGAEETKESFDDHQPC